MAAYSVHLTDSDFPDIELESSILAQIGATLQRHTCRSPEEVIEHCRDADALLVQWASLTPDVFKQLPQLKAVARFGIGVDMIDLAAATDQGVAVCNTPTYCIEEVATHALGMILALNRRLFPYRSALTRQLWGVKAVDGAIQNLSSQVLGLVGVGRIGGRLAELAQCLGMKVIAYDPYASQVEIPLVSFSDLLMQSDYISIHCPLTEETRRLFDDSAFAAMKRSAYLVNVARGAVVDTPALQRALLAGEIAGAALDVLPQEPPVWDDPLLSMPNLILTPHVAWYSDGSPHHMRKEAATALVDLFCGKRPAGLLNAEVLQTKWWSQGE